MSITETPIRVVDVETTGLDPDEGHRIIEIGWQDVVFTAGERWETDPGYGGSMLCDPGRDIPPEAKAVHHITEEMVEGKPAPELVLPGILTDGRHFAAHNAAFDMKFCGGKGWLCTMRLAKHLWPDAPAYGNQVLRYWRDVDTGWDSAYTAAHRAAFDAACTAAVLCDLLNTEELLLSARSGLLFSQLVAIADSPVLLKGKLGFGQHAELTWQEVARKHRNYLEWMVFKATGDWDPDRLYTAKHHLGLLV